MALVSAKQMLNKAREEGYAVAQININNLEWTQAALKAAEELKSPIILGVSEGAGRYMGGFKTVVNMVENLMDYYKITVPVALHLDHGSFDGSMEALEAGFSSIMFDGSSYPIEENVKKTSEVIKKAHAIGVSVEAEVGGIGGEEDGVTSDGELADVEECKMIAELGVDLFAAGIGNIHGTYPEDWKGLNFELLEEISEAIGRIPLVLHGGTGIPEEQVLRAIKLGVSKINVNTECQLAFAAATRKYIEEDGDLKGKGFDPRKLLKPGTDAIIEVVKEKLTMFGSVNKA